MTDVLMMTRRQAGTVADALDQARALKAYVLLLSHSSTPPNALLIQQAKRLDEALKAIELTR